MNSRRFIAFPCSATAYGLLWAKSGHSRRVRPFIEKRYRRDVEHARARALYRFRSGLLAGPAIQNNNPDQGCDHQRATESRCQCPVIYCRDLHLCRLGGAANAICEVGHNNMKFWLMSALGQKRTWAVQKGMSALGQKRTFHYYSMISSARASSEGGMVRPRAFAVFRFMMSSYLLGACTGRSAGFSPFNMRSM